jgi:hypothetical protein
MGDLDLGGEFDVGELETGETVEGDDNGDDDGGFEGKGAEGILDKTAGCVGVDVADGGV